MNKRLSKVRRILIPFAACALLLLASLANFLVHNDYPLLRLDVVLVVSLILAFSAFAAGIYLILPSWGRSLLEGLLAALFVELNTTWLWLAIAVGVGVAAVTFWRRTSATKPMAFFGGFILVTTVLGVGGRTPWINTAQAKTTEAPADESRPAIVHLILDEHIGIEGLLDGDPDAVALRGQLKSFYLNAGFATYGGAYSEHMRTMNAIPHVLNYGEHVGLGMRGQTAVIGPTTYLGALAELGYPITVFQADYADFCSDVRFSRCVTYQSYSPTALLAAPLTTPERAGLIMTKFLSLSRIADAGLLPWRIVADRLDLPQLSPRNLGRSTSVATLQALDELGRILATARPGNVYFAHVLLPHYPYAFDENCGLRRWRNWEKPFAGRNLAKRQHAYYAQVRCTTRKVAGLLNALERSPAGRNVIVIIHGDHGSRITEVEPSNANIGKFKDSDVIATYSTLFAVRTPQGRPRYISERLPIALLLADFARGGFKNPPSPPAPSHRTIYLDGLGGAPGQRASLPRNWL